MVDIFHEEDGNLSIIKDKRISIIGYGNQGRAQALNLRDSGLNIIVGNVDDNYKNIALNDNFFVFTIKEATEKSDIIFILLIYFHSFFISLGKQYFRSCSSSYKSLHFI